MYNIKMHKIEISACWKFASQPLSGFEEHLRAVGYIGKEFDHFLERFAPTTAHPATHCNCYVRGAMFCASSGFRRAIARIAATVSYWL